MFCMMVLLKRLFAFYFNNQETDFFILPFGTVEETKSFYFGTVEKTKISYFGTVEETKSFYFGIGEYTKISYFGTVEETKIFLFWCSRKNTDF
jgi:hypothetical protein